MNKKILFSTISFLLLMIVLVPAGFSASSLTLNGQSNDTVSEKSLVQIEAYTNQSLNKTSVLERNGDVIVDERLFETDHVVTNNKVQSIRLFNGSWLKIEKSDFLSEGVYNYTFYPNYNNKSNNLTATLTVNDGYTNQSNSAMVYIGIVLVFLTLLVSLPLFFFERLWIKSATLTMLNIMVVILLRFGSEFIDITMPGTHLADSLNVYYSWAVTVLPWTVLAGVGITLMLVLYALFNLGTGKNRDFEEDMKNFGS